MIDFSYLYKGLCGLARAHQAGTMAGHLGAALVAGYFIGEEHPDLDQRVYRGIEKELDRIVAGEEAIWFNAKKAGITVKELFQPLPKEKPAENKIAGIAEALSGNIDKTRQSGHNVIFASTALRALHDHTELATPSMIGGIVKLIEGFDGVVPGRGYYGKQRGWIIGNKVKLEADKKFPPYANEKVMSEVVVGDVIDRVTEHRRGFGGLFHIINHAAGLTELSQYGYDKLARQGLPAHRQHVRLWHSLPDLKEELGTIERSEHDPRTAKYWGTGMLKRDSARLTHRIKTIYGFFTLLRFIDDPARRKKAEERFLYMMA